MASSNSSGKLKVLMLHGYRQNEKLFKDRTGSLRKILRNYVDFVYCEAPHVLQASGLDANERGWWLRDAETPVDFEAHFANTLSFLNEVFEAKGPFDGVFGFSQGGIISTILCNQNNLSGLSALRFKFAVIAAAKVPNEKRLSKYFDDNARIEVPSLHIVGMADKLVDWESSVEMGTKYFNGARIFKHESGHCIPWNSQAKEEYLNFFKEMLEKKTSQ